MGRFFDTPKKARVQGAIQWAKHLSRTAGIPYNRSAISKEFDVDEHIVRRWEADPSSRTFNHNPFSDETRGRPRKLSDKDVQAIAAMYSNEGYEARHLPWAAQAGAATDADICGRTVQRSLGRVGYRKCIAAEKESVRPADAKARVDYARARLEAWDLEDWKQVRFSDECHFGWIYQYRGCHEYISRKPGERNKPDYIRQRPPKKQTTDQQPLHVWSAVGWDFKGPLVRYQALSPNGKLSQRVYIDQILDPAVRP